MRQLTTVCAVAMMTFAAFAMGAAGRRAHAAAATPPQSTPQSSGSSTNASAGDARKVSAPGNSGQIIVVAEGLPARALALNASPLNSPAANAAQLYLTRADSPNRIFALRVLGASGFGTLIGAARPALIGGVGTAGSLGDGGAATAAQFDMKAGSLAMRSGIAIAPDGELFVADTLNSSIRGIAGPDSSDPGIVRAIAGRWGPRANVTLDEPMGVAIDRAGNLYIADYAANAVDVLPAAGSSTAGELQILAPLAGPAAIAVTPDGSKIFAASPETGSVFAIDARTRSLQTVIAASPSAPSNSSATNSSACAAAMNGVAAQPTGQSVCPAGLAVDGRGDLFIADAAKGQILRVDAVTNKITIAAHSLSQPGDVAFDARGDLYVAEQGRNQVVELQSLGMPVSSLSLSPASAPFPNVPTGGASQITSLTLTNGSANSLAGISWSFTPAGSTDFTIESTNCLSTLAANASCTFNIAFTPSATGARSATLTVTDTASDSAASTLSGTGDDYQLALASGQPQEISVAPGSTATFKLQVIPDNTFTGTVTIVCPAVATPGSTATNILPPYSACTATPPSVTVTAGTPAPFTIAISTSSAATPASGYAKRALAAFLGRSATSTPGSLRVLLFPALLAIAILAGALEAVRRLFAARLLCAVAQRPLRARVPRPISVTALAALFLVAGALVGCHHHSAAVATTATPAGTYSPTIQGTAQNAQGVSLQATRGFTLTLGIN